MKWAEQRAERVEEGVWSSNTVTAVGPVARLGKRSPIS